MARRKAAKKKASKRRRAAAQQEQLTHKQLLKPLRASVPGQALPVLGHARAVVIVTACANTSPLNL